LKKLVEGKKTQDKLKWVNSPNVYQKVEVLETGTTEPKKITKWVQDGSSSPSHGTAVKIENPHQFVPVAADPEEFRRKQQRMKAVRLENKITSGPESHILEGVTWEEVNRLENQKTADHTVIVGAASKGIIQKEFQHNAMVYKSAYAKNPFDNVTDEELEEYRKIVERKQRGEPVDDIPENVRHLLVEPLPPQQQAQPDRITSPVSPTSPSDEEEGSSMRSTTASSMKDGKDKKDKKKEKEEKKKEKKKEKGFRTPSFLKKKKEKEEKRAEAV